MNRSLSALQTVLIFALAGTAAAHDDDPKLRDRQIPYQGPGYTSALDLFGMPSSGAVSQQMLANCGQFQCSGVRLLSWMPLNLFNNASAGNSCWGYTSPSGREYALMGISNGTGFVDITVPGSPVLVAHMAGPSSTWRDVKAFDHYVYAVSEAGQGIQVFDVANIDSGVVTYLGDITTGGTTATHTVAVDPVSGYLYRAGGGSNGIRIYDLNANPASPTLVATWSVQYVHEASVYTLTTGPYAGRQIAFLSTGSGQTLRTLDVTNKSNIVSLDQIGYPNSGYAHQSWISDDGRYMYLDDEFDEPPLPTTTLVFDVFDPSNLVFLGSFTNNNPAVGHNLYLRGNLIYEANYRSGLRVFDISTSKVSPPEVYWFDTYPPDDSAQYNGLWGCYTLFNSGTIIGSDRERGLFVWWVGKPQLGISYPNGIPATVNAYGDTVRVKITPEPGSFVQSGTEMFHYNTGAGFVSAPLQSVRGDLYDAVFPALACNTQVTWYVSASSTSNIVWASPELAPSATWSSTATCPPGAFTYCAAKTNSCGGTPALGFSGSSSASQSSGFTLTASGARFGKSGLMIYTNMGTGSTPFQGGTLCVNAPGVKRGPTNLESGATPGNCDGAFTLDINAFAAGAAGGNPQAYLMSPGTQVNVQFWGRDTVASGSYLSNGGQYVVGP